MFIPRPTEFERVGWVWSGGGGGVVVRCGVVVGVGVVGVVGVVWVVWVGVEGVGMVGCVCVLD